MFMNNLGWIPMEYHPVNIKEYTINLSKLRRGGGPPTMLSAATALHFPNLGLTNPKSKLRFIEATGNDTQPLAQLACTLTGHAPHWVLLHHQTILPKAHLLLL
ncbi:hypothetical protein AX15_000798 [Amanita polypyramis BW_CC]|nr:hypothetical protein AX15_000798 [Amanita polypyramis BW_CC]